MSHAPEPIEASNDDEPNITVIDGQAATTSMAVAEFFGKQHQHVMRAIRSILDADPEAQSNFGPRSRVDGNGRQRPYYTMDRTGFVMLGMGFTGAEAIRWRRRYIAAFDAMEHELTRQDEGASIGWALRDRRIQIIERIIEDTREPVRRALHADLHHICTRIGEPTPPLRELPPMQQAIGEHKPSEHRHLGVKFWQAVRELVAQEVPINHAIAPGLCAIHMPTLRSWAKLNGHNLGRKSELKQGLQALDTPAFLNANQSVKSYITGKSTRCWVFETEEFDITPARRKIERARIERLAGLRD